MKREVLEEVEQLLRVYCHHPDCRHPRECPRGHPRCAERLGYSTAIAWVAADIISEVLEGVLSAQTGWRLLTVLLRVVGFEDDEELFGPIHRTIDALIG